MSNPITLDKFKNAKEVINNALIEREDEIDLALTALVAKENLLLVGSPGTAKTLLLNSVASFAGGTTFNALMMKTMAPEELYGPLDIPGLKIGKYERKTEGYLPTADFAFLDEVWRASSAVLNTLLKILNEGTYKNGTTESKVPLRLCVAASNSWPNYEDGQAELGALFDRFLFRKKVDPIVTRKGKDKLLYAPEKEFQPVFKDHEILNSKDTISLDKIKVSDNFKESLNNCLKELREKGIAPGDRRLKKSIKVCKAKAWLDGQNEVQNEHGQILSHVLWIHPDERDKAIEIVNKNFDPIGNKVKALILEIDEIYKAIVPGKFDTTSTAFHKLKEIKTKIEDLKEPKSTKTAIDHVNEKLRQIKEDTLKI